MDSLQRFPGKNWKGLGFCAVPFMADGRACNRLAAFRCGSICPECLTENRESAAEAKKETKTRKENHETD